MSDQAINDKVIAFIEGSTVVNVLETNEQLAGLIMGNSLKLDVSNLTGENAVKAGYIYNESDGSFIPVETPIKPSGE